MKQGGKIILGDTRKGSFYDPTVLIDVPKTADVAKNLEIFGPVVPIIGADTDQEVMEIANACMFGLSSCVFSKNIKRVMRIASFCYGSRWCCHKWS